MNKRKVIAILVCLFLIIGLIFLVISHHNKTDYSLTAKIESIDEPYFYSENEVRSFTDSVDFYMTNCGMTKKQAEDFIENSENYHSVDFTVTVTNTSEKILYSVRPCVSELNESMWIDTNTFGEYCEDLEPGESVTNSVSVIFKGDKPLSQSELENIEILFEADTRLLCFSKTIISTTE